MSTSSLPTELHPSPVFVQLQPSVPSEHQEQLTSPNFPCAPTLCGLGMRLGLHSEHLTQALSIQDPSP